MTLFLLLLVLVEKPQALSLSVQPTRERYAPDQPIAFHLKASQDCYLYVFNFVGGKYVQLTPKMGETSRLMSGQEVLYPGGNLWLRSPQEGKEVFYFVVAGDPVDWELTLEREPGETRAFRSGEFLTYVEHLLKQGPVVKRVEVAIVKQPAAAKP
jgi:Domain of unknown function (DUF4384)